MLFNGSKEATIDDFYFNKSESTFYSYNEVLYSPNQKIQGYHIILKGNIYVCENEIQLENDEFEVIDDYLNILLYKDHIYLENEDKYLTPVRLLKPGDSFGILDFYF